MMKISVIIYNFEMFYGVYNQCRLISSVKKKKTRSVAIRELSGSWDVLPDLLLLLLLLLCNN